MLCSNNATCWERLGALNDEGPDVSARPFAERNYLMILVTVPAPTVRPPSRMAKLRPSSMAMG